VRDGKGQALEEYFRRVCNTCGSKLQLQDRENSGEGGKKKKKVWKNFSFNGEGNFLKQIRIQGLGNRKRYSMGAVLGI